MLKCHDRCPSLNPSRKLQNKNFWHRRQIWLDCKQQSENSILVLTCQESDWEPNTIVIEHSFIFPTVIYTSRYGKRFRSYEFLNNSPAAVSLCWQTETPRKTVILTTAALSSQKTCNTTLVVNFLYFPVITRMLKSDKQGRNYDCWNTAYKWKNPDCSFWFGLMMISQNSANWIRCRIMRKVQYKSDRKIWDLSRKNKYTLIRLMVQELWSLKFGGVSSGQIELSGQIWTLRPLPNEFWGNREYQNPREFCNLSNGG
jgi:hypothetical protein